MNKITEEKLEKYFNITEKAFKIAKENKVNNENADDFLDMIERYIKDAKFFKEKNDIINAFAAIVYAHGWLDAGARIRLFNVNDSNLFTAD